MIEKAPSHRISRVDFSVYSRDEILKLSVKEITNPQIFDSLQHATPGGLYDRALGPSERDDVCVTCGLNLMLCPGHMGHMVLPLTVYNPVFFRQLFAILKASCFSCKRLLVHSAKSHLLLKSLEMLNYGLASSIDGLNEIYYNALSSGVVLTADDIQEEKSTESFNKQEVIRALDAYCQSAVAEAKTMKGNKELPDGRASRYSVSCRQELIAEVQRCQFTPRASPKCDHCQVPARSMRAENYCKIFFNKGIRMQAVHKAELQTRDAYAEEAIVDDELADYEDNEGASRAAGISTKKYKSSADTDSAALMRLTEQEYLTPSSAKEHMQALWQQESFALSLVFGMLHTSQNDTKACPTDVFFLDVVPVPPTRFRPTMYLKGRQYANSQTTNLNKVLSSCVAIRTILQDMREKESKLDTSSAGQGDSNKGHRASDRERLYAAWITLQVHVNCLYDSDLDRITTERTPGVKQILEKKEGLFRKHMMGKRVDYAARSVISPDPYISVDEIGIPMVFAKKLTYPEPVTTWNIDELRQAVLNGPDVHPGASHVEMDSGKKVLLSATDKTQREALAKSLLTQAASVDQLLIQPKKVHRHLRSGDILLLNRQPTLHKPSIQAHRARVLPGEKTLRLHYACCKAYNADFDGDEMNAHFPQNEFGRAEAYNIVSVRNQYLVPKDGTPLAGLIQDHMVSGAWLTMRGRFFNRCDYQQLVYSAFADLPTAVKLLRPSILKPKTLWSGKQVLSTVLLNIIPKSKPPLNLCGKAKISPKTWQTGPCRGQTKLDTFDHLCESEVVIRQGELLCGILDKNHYGATPYSLVHCCYELYGGETSTRALTCFAKLFTAFLQYRGFSLGIEDILVTKEANRERRHAMKNGRRAGFTALAAAFAGPAGTSNCSKADKETADELAARYRAAQFAADDVEMRGIDRAMKNVTDEIQNQITKACMPLGLLKKFPDNNLQLMVLSGAKGSSVNCMQISCLLGQMELEGRRPPLMLSGRTLPSFLPYDPSPRAGGFIDARFLTGLKPQEYFFHCMAGREGLVDTAVKTSRSGYLQRCIIKHLEGLTVTYDLTVRDTDSSIIQFQYGEDGLEIGKTQFLNQKQFPFLIENQSVVLCDDELNQVATAMDLKKASKHARKVSRSKNKASKNARRATPFLMYSQGWSDSLAAVQPITSCHRSPDAQKIVAAYRNLNESKIDKYRRHCGRALPPVMSSLNPNRYFGSIPEKLADVISNYIETNPHGMIVADNNDAPGSDTCHISAERFKTLVNLRCLRSLTEPGEAVGLLAAQSIGEPSTQMTLNTFHFAGRGDMNVTLGIPRLREVLMVASANIKTPTMEIPVLNPASKRARRRAEALQRRLCRVTLDEVIESVQIWESLDVIMDSSRHHRNFKIRFNFLPQSQYGDRCALTSQKVLQFFERHFVSILRDSIYKAIKIALSSGLTRTARVQARKGGKNDEDKAAGTEDDDGAADDEDDDEQHDGDAAAAKAHERHAEERDYAGEDEEKRELAIDDDDDDDERENDGAAADDGAASDNSRISSGDEDDDGLPRTAKQKLSSSQHPTVTDMAAGRIHHVTSTVPDVVHYAYNAEKEEWAEVTFQFGLVGSKIDVATVIQNEARKAVVYHTPGIRRSFLSTPTGSQAALLLRTDGVNILEMYKHSELLDLSSLYTNDIQAMLHSYGVEAAARVIIKECRDVFAAYGIDVDYRHLSLIADYMTYDGTYKPFNRIGIEANPSPMQKMSFETTMHFLKTATMEGASDDLNSPSSRLVTGRVVKGGTGCFDLLLSSE